VAIPDELIEEIRERTDIIQVIGENVQLKKAGVNWKGLCPFHQEKTPSFHVNPVRRSFYCFGCQKKGDVFNFVMELQGKSFFEVVRELAARAQILLPEKPESPEQRERRSERERLFELNKKVARFYRGHLDLGWRYLKSRGIGEQIAEQFQLGCAPNEWDALARFLEAEKVHVQLPQTLGLIAPRQSKGGYYDKFRNRLMCPVILPAGEVAGFSGRTLGADQPDVPKYMNSPESAVYRKSQLLFGLHAARPAFHKKGRALLVEGNFDVIAMHQAGFDETVAPLGTALTADQVEVLRRLSDSVVVCFDGDKAGRAAALRAIPLLMSAGVKAKVAKLPDGEDPDTLVRKQGPAALEKAIADARSLVDAFVDHLWFQTDADRSPETRAENLKEAAALVASVQDRALQITLTDHLASMFEVSRDSVRALINSGSPAPGRASQAAPPAPAQVVKTEPPPAAELKLFAILSDHPDLAEAADQLGIGSLLTDTRLRDMYLAARKGRSFLDAAPSDIRDLVAREVLSGSWSRVPNPRRSLEEAVRNLEVDRLLGEAERLSHAVKDAQRRGDATLVRELHLKHFETRKRAEELKRRPEEEPR
jgi:DNA primase